MLRASLEEELSGSSEFLPPLPAAQGLCLFQSSSFSSITDSTMSLNIITVTLNMGESHEMTLSSTCYVPDTGSAERHTICSLPSRSSLSKAQTATCTDSFSIS